MAIAISIPSGTIKRASAGVNTPKVDLFQFLLVRLKAFDPLAVFQDCKFQFLLVRLKGI